MSPKDGRWLTWIVLMTALLALSACGATPSQADVQIFIREHSECPKVTYSLPLWSQDGESIYYFVYGRSSVDVHVMSRFGKSDQKLGQVEDVLGPRLSPDHTKLLMQRQNPQGVQAYDYYTLDLATGKIRMAAALGDWASWSPDGEWFVYVTHITALDRLYKANPSTGETIGVTDVAVDASYSERNPFWSPDGKTIAFTTSDNRGRSKVTLIAPDGTGRHTVPVTHHKAICPAGSPDMGDEVRGWLPGSGSLVVAHDCGASELLSVITLAGDETADLSGLSGAAYDLSWSPDETQVAFTTALGQAYPFSIANADGSNARSIQPASSNPVWSPDGSQIVFAGYDPAGFSEIFTIRPDGTGLAQLTDNPAGKICLH